MEEQQLWHRVNRRLIARIIAEGSFEGCLTPELLNAGRYRLIADGQCYDFLARRTPWDYLWIQPDTITRNGSVANCAAQAVLDCQTLLGMNDVTLGNFLEEIYNTLAGDRIQQQQLAGLSAGQLLDLPATQLEALLDGHPKALANRGRLGWGLADLQKFSPEAAQTFELRWLAIHRDACPQVSGNPVPSQCLPAPELQAIRQGFPESQWHLMPVHPWQWDRLIRIQYADLQASGLMQDLGPGGYHYRPQQSIRTLSNRDHPDHCDLKLSLTILNTSCYRGIPAQTMALAPALSDWLDSMARTDPVLASAGLTVQRELGGIHLPHPQQSSITGTPYRYREMLGAVWRESLAGKTREGEKGFLFSSLLQRDSLGRSLVAEMIRRSGLLPEQWLTRLFDRVTLPLYHLLVRYGIGMVAHGQNLGLILKDWQPERVVIKDFHGDLRAAETPIPEQGGVPQELLNRLTRLPTTHLLHDLYTGHMVTALRFISPLLEEECAYPEDRFYRLLASRLHQYQQQHPELTSNFTQFDLLRPSMERVCINRVRFRIGYGDDAARPLPETGNPLSNPLQLEPVHD